MALCPSWPGAAEGWGVWTEALASFGPVRGAAGRGVVAPAPLSCAQKRETQTRSRAHGGTDLCRCPHTVLGLSRSLRRWKAFLNKLSVRTT